MKKIYSTLQTQWSVDVMGFLRQLYLRNKDSFCLLNSFIHSFNWYLPSANYLRNSARYWGTTLWTGEERDIRPIKVIRSCSKCCRRDKQMLSVWYSTLNRVSLGRRYSQLTPEGKERVSCVEKRKTRCKAGR